MSYADVCEAVESLQRKYCERDPFRLCADMGIKLLYQPLGTDPDLSLIHISEPTRH